MGVLLFGISVWAFINGFTLLSSADFTKTATIETLGQCRSVIATFMLVLAILWFWIFFQKTVLKDKP